REARDDRLELVGGLVDEAVLAEHPPFPEVLLYELLVLVAQGTADLDRRAGGGLGRAAGNGGHRRRSARRDTDVEVARGHTLGEVELLLDELGHRLRRRCGGRCGRRAPSELALHEVELGSVLLVLWLALHE